MIDDLFYKYTCRIDRSPIDSIGMDWVHPLEFSHCTCNGGDFSGGNTLLSSGKVLPIGDGTKIEREKELGRCFEPVLAKAFPIYWYYR